MIYLLLLSHIFFTVKLGFIQKRTFEGIKYTFKKRENGSGIGTYRAFAAALGTTVGPGNITGVALAISLGGPGAVFWMWLCGALAMSTKYAESRTAIENRGGTMIILRNLKKPRLAVFWSCCCAMAGLLMGSAVPASALASSVSAPRWITGVFLAMLVLVTISFGMDGIAKISGLLVPVMSIAFLLFCFAVIFKNFSNVSEGMAQIITGAFSFRPLLSGSAGAALKHGMMRGMYSNESGLGSGGLLAAESGDSDSDMSALSAMTTVFWDTVVICAVTGVMFVMTGARQGEAPEQILSDAFSQLPFGYVFLGISMSLFVYASIIGWYYIAKRAVSFLSKNTLMYDVMFVIAVFAGTVCNFRIVWSAADAVNLLMLLPSLYAVIKSTENRNKNFT